MNRVIRQYRPGDVEPILEAWASASRVGHPFLSDAFLAQEREMIRNVYLPGTDTRTWVIVQDARVIGFISMLGNEIGGLFVHADFHGSGAGRALVDKAKSLHDIIELDVFEDNIIGRNFYTRCGFALLRRTTEPQTGLPVLRLRFTSPGL